MNKVQIIGAGGFAREIAAYCQYYGAPCQDYALDYEFIQDGKNSIEDQIETDLWAVIAIGDPNARESICKRIDGQLYTILVWGDDPGDSLMGEGTIICPGTIITVNVTIGRHVIINLNCTIGHDCQIGDFTTISPGANISGNVKIGKRCYIGTGAVIREKITICDDVTIGAGGVVVKDITEPGVYVGNPVKQIK